MTDTLGLGTFRSEMATWLADELPTNIGVFDAIPDSIAPPAVYITWGSPMLTQTTFCEYTSMAQLIVVAQRIEPGGQYNVLESMVSQVLAVLRNHRIALRDVTPPYPLVFAGVNYLSTSVNIIHEMGE
jgi:hypothetical protein